MTFAWIMTGFALWAGIAALTAYVLGRRARRANPRVVNGLTALFSAGFILLALELAFFSFSTQTDGLTFTLSTRRWFEKHWNPVNSLGLRDLEPEFDARARGRRLALVVGDSFAAGYGIKNHENTMAGILRRELGDDWRLVNLARPGWSTWEQAWALRSIPAPEIDLIALIYLINDIKHAAQVHGRALSPPEQPTGPLGLLVERSHFFNFIYWKALRFRSARHISDDYWERMAGFYNDPRIWETHEAELVDFTARARERGAELVVVVFPNLLDSEWSRPFTKKVGAVFAREGVPVIDLAEEFLDKPPAELTVNRFDSHPNKAVHRHTAFLIHELLQREGILQER